MDELNHEDFVKKLKSGDEFSFQILFNALIPKLCSFIARMGLDSQDAEELAVDTMVKVQRAFVKYNPRGGAKLTTWIFEIARNTAIDHQRKCALVEEKTPRELRPPEPSQDSGKRQLSDRNLTPFSIPHREDDSNEDDSPNIIRLRSALASLSEDNRDILRMKQVMTYEEIAECQNISTGAARTRYSRAFERLREAYERE